MLLKRLLDSIAETVSDPDRLEIVLYVDEDDVESREVSHPSLSIVRQIGPRLRKSMGAIFRQCFEASRGRYVMLINDDVVFRTKDWDLKVLEGISRFPDEVVLVYGKDRYYDDEMCTFPILPRTTCDLMDGICPAEYDNHCIDSHVFDTFERLSSLGHDRSVYLPKVVFEHMNYEVGTWAYEQGFNRKNDRDDQAVYLSFAQQRQSIAEKMAQYIESHKEKPTEAIVNRAVGNESSADSVSQKTGRGSEKSLVSIIIPVEGDSQNYMGAYLKAVLESNDEKALSMEFIVVANGQGELAFECPRKIRKNLRIVSSEEPNSAGIYNAGASAARGDYLVFLKVHSCPQRGWLKALVEAAQEERIGVVGSRWLNSRNGRVEHVGMAFYRDNGDLKETDIYRGLAANHPAVNKMREVQAVRLVGMLIKRDLFVALGGCGETCPGLEGLDLCLKVRQSGKRIVCAPQADLYCDRREDCASYVTHSNEKTTFLSSRSERIRCDLEDILAEDGFELHSWEDTSYIFPSERKIKELGDMKGGSELVRELLEESLEVLKTVRGGEDDLARTCKELLDIYFFSGRGDKVGKIHRLMQEHELSEPVALAAYEHMVPADKRNMGTAESVDMYAGTRFVIPVAGSVSQVRMRLYKKGEPTDGIVAYIYDDNEGPNMPLPHAVSEPVGAESITSEAEGRWVEFVFSEDIPLSANVFYWIVLHRTGAADYKNYYRIMLDSSGDCRYPYASDYYGGQPRDGNIGERISQLFKVTGVVTPKRAPKTRSDRTPSAMKQDLQNEYSGEVSGGQYRFRS
jgi:hypothetical protein